MSEATAEHHTHEPTEPLAAVPEPASEPAKAGRNKSTSYVVLRRKTAPDSGHVSWTEVDTLVAASRKAAVREATKDLTAEQRGGEFAIVRESDWVTLSRRFEQRTVDEDVFE